jgi:hypothetical protein
VRDLERRGLLPSDLVRARALLERLEAELPVLAPYDSLKDEKLPWGDEVAAAVKKAKSVKNPGTSIKRTSKRTAGRKAET